jgi:hypothetical protein
MRRFAGWTMLVCAAAPAGALAQSVKDVIPLGEPNCSVDVPPASAGLAATPGGFVMVHPRNPALPANYTGCKMLWIVDGDRMLRYATLYFKAGKLRTAAAHDIRDRGAKLDAACAFPEGKSLLPGAGRKVPDSGCKGFAADEFYGLHLPTWPRTCLTAPDSAVCQKDPE